VALQKKAMEELRAREAVLIQHQERFVVVQDVDPV
jgi:hypothetical protein